ncbi:MAG: GatB/YqeY domain-containing protein [Rikenellaceae bacterium]|nr:GatB/YqeY domain-containing protein [Rikenellaceae bacterium]
MTLEEQISEGIKNAMKAKDKVRLETLRNVKKYIIEAKTAGANQTGIQDGNVIKIITKLAKQGSDSAEIYKTQNRDDLYRYEMEQVNVLKEFLPQQLSKEELTAEVEKIVASTGASSMKDMGKVMGTASKELAGRAEGKDISDTVKEILSRS